MKKQKTLGVDTGGTFTDFVLFDGEKLTIHKVLSTPKAPEQAILQGIRELRLENDLANIAIVHGSTVATNAALEGKGVKTAYITNKGLADVLTIGRQARKELYNLKPQPVPPPVPAELCLEIDVRLDVNGKPLVTLSNEKLETLLQQLKPLAPEAIAINLLYSFKDHQDELAIEKYLAEHLNEKDLFICRSSKVLAEYKEYERGMATWLNAWLGPRVQGYLQRLKQGVQPASITVMQSSGGTMSVDYAAENAVRMLLSGPAGGLAGAQYIAKMSGFEHILTFDMGGTSTDVAVIEEQLRLTNQGKIGDYPVAIAMVDMHTIGAGGGSIAHIDEGGILQVGPQSAGALPGPACYGLGGTEATVTDANLILGKLSADNQLAGNMNLDLKAAEIVMEKLAQQINLDIYATADGIIRVANEHMSRALRVMSVQRGIDPTNLALVPFGGAGGLHVCALADSLNMRRAMVPIHAGVLSALGMIVAPAAREMSQTHNQLLDENIPDKDLSQSINQMLNALAQRGRDELLQEGIIEDMIEYFYSLDLRYKGQSYTLNLAWESVQSPIQPQIQKTIQGFHQLHQLRYGHQHAQMVELVNLRVKVQAQTTQLELPKIKTSDTNSTIQSTESRQLFGINDSVPVYHREKLLAGNTLIGPALITEQVSTTFIDQGWTCTIDQFGNLILTK